MTRTPTRPRAARPRFAPAVLAAGVLSTALLGLTTTGSLSGFVATLTNDSATAATGSLILREQDASRGTTCLSTQGSSGIDSDAVSCGMNLLGGSTTMTPGVPVTTTVYLKNTGTLTGSAFSLLPSGPCSQSANGSASGSGNLCDRMTVTVYKNATATGQPVFSGSATALGTATSASFTGFPGSLAPNDEQAFTFVSLVPNTSSTTNAFQGLSVSVPLVWTLSS